MKKDLLIVDLGMHVVNLLVRIFDLLMHMLKAL